MPKTPHLSWKWSSSSDERRAREPATGPLKIISTLDDTDPLEWRQYHHWNVAPNFVTLQLPKGKSVLTVHILAEGHMNLATFDFKRVK